MKPAINFMPISSDCILTHRNASTCRASLCRFHTGRGCKGLGPASHAAAARMKIDVFACDPEEQKVAVSEQSAAECNHTLRSVGHD
jgi:hypothetical protein